MVPSPWLRQLSPTLREFEFYWPRLVTRVSFILIDVEYQQCCSKFRSHTQIGSAAGAAFRRFGWATLEGGGIAPRGDKIRRSTSVECA